MESLDSGINTGIPYFFTHNTFLKSFVISEKIYTSQGSGSGGIRKCSFARELKSTTPSLFVDTTFSDIV